MEEERTTFEKIYNDQSDAIFRFCVLRVSNREQALDLTQEAFLRLWQEIKKGERIENEKAYLFTIARRLIIDWYRKKKSISLDAILDDPQGGDRFPDSSSHSQVEIGAEAHELLDAIDTLPENHRDPIYLRFVEGLSPKEIGEVIGISANAASVRINRAVKELRKTVGYDQTIEQKYE